MNKYRLQQMFTFPKRTWPCKTITRSPRWCSVDLRDGNQALVNPMTPEQKLAYFTMLSAIGFKDIEISFPSASESDYRFTRHLIEGGFVAIDTRLQVLTQAREVLIRKSFKALRDAPEIIIHMYNSTSPAQRKVVFGKSPSEVIALAVEGVGIIRQEAANHNGVVTLEYSPESFSQTEPDFAVAICNAVIEAWNPCEEERVIINLPATVEITSPNTFADMVEYVAGNLIRRKCVELSIHTHNDRGCAVAAAELAMLAGADRVEGTLFGNGERTGNADLITLALNLVTQGIETGLAFNTIESIADRYESLTGMTVSPRHPYAGKLVFTAFSGSHQDAISKGITNYNLKKGTWNVPYLPIDPKDVGRSYEEIIRINSQSGKGGVAWILKQRYGLQIPREMYGDLGVVVQRAADKKEKELSAEEVYRAFYKECVNREQPLQITEVKRIDNPAAEEPENPAVAVSTEIHFKDKVYRCSGVGTGLLDAVIHALETIGVKVKIHSFYEHSMGDGSDARATAYIDATTGGERSFGVGMHTDIATASLRALTSALNRIQQHNKDAVAPR